MKKIISYLTVLFLTLTVMAAELPAGEFPGADGSAEVTLVFKKSDVKNQVIFQLYSVKGDIFYLRAAKNRLQAAFYDRSEKKWYRSTGNRPLPEKKACKAGVIWSIPGRIDITLDGKEAGGVAVDVPPVFDKKSQLTVGSDQSGGNKFAGEIKNLIFTSVKSAAAGQTSNPSATAADVQKKTSVNAEYVFELTIDEPLKDLSGNGYHPLNTPVESKFVKSVLDAIRFAADGDGVRLPSGAFPGSSGALEITANPEKGGSGKAKRHLFEVFSPAGDIFSLYRKQDNLYAGYYNSAEKKWYITTPALQLPQEKFSRINLSWQFPGRITLSVNSKTTAEVRVSETSGFAGKTAVFIGSDHRKKQTFHGLIHSVKFLNYQQHSGKTVRKSAVRKAVELVTHRLGGITLGFDKNTLELQSMVCGKVEYFSSGINIPPWTMRIYDVKDKRHLDIDPSGAGGTSYRLSKNAVKFIWRAIPLPDGSKFDASGTVSAAGKNKLNWQFTSGTLPERYAVDTVVYPRLPCRPTTNDPLDMYLCYPKYYGINIPDAFNLQTKRERSFGSTYPGGAHYQFVYLYGKNVPGIFLHTPDKNGNFKEFIFRALPKQKTLLLQLFQNPAQRAVSRRFVPQYPVHTEIIPGDWYDAAKLYRKWAVEQPWSAKGTLDKRSDLPKWVFDTHIAVRPSCQSKSMTDVETGTSRVKLNLSNFRIIRDDLRCGGLAIWYSYYYADPGTRSRWTGASARFNGRPEMKLIPGVNEVVKEFKTGGIYSIGFLNTRIYDDSPDPDHADTKAVEPLVMRNPDGTFQRYSNLPFDVCRIAKPWQERLLKIIKHRTEVNGFDGMYLDSFGRGQYHCWAENHGHLPGSATASVAGQRKMAKLIKTEMAKIVPGFVISSEANIEQFVDLIDFKLHHENIYEHAVPVWTKIYHDRQFVYGRSANPARIQATACFHIGALLGRIFIGNKDEGLRKNYLSQEIAAYYRQLIAMRKYFYSQIGVGEMLRPPQVTGDIPAVRETVSKKKFSYPAVTASAWRSSSGVPCAFFTNASAQNVKFSFSLDKNEFTAKPANWVIADGEGNLRKIPFDGRYSFELPPLSIAALEFR